MRTDPASANLSDRLVASVGQAVSARTTPRLYKALLRLSPMVSLSPSPN